MAKLIRFHSWIINQDEIIGSEIKETENEKADLILTMKDGKTFTLHCYSRDHAERELDYLTVNAEALYVGTSYKHYLIERIHQTRDYMIALSNDVKKLMKSYSTTKKKLKKKG